MANSNLKADMNIIPLMDIMILILCMFVISYSAKESSIAVDLPNSKGALEVEERVVKEQKIVVTVTTDGKYYLNNLHLGRESEYSVKEIGMYVKKMIVDGVQFSVAVRGDRNVGYENVTNVIGVLKESGVPKVGLVVAGN